MMYKKVSIADEEPKEAGKYIVITRTSMGNSNTFNCTYHPPSKEGKKGTWGCTNQVVTHWLKEI